MRLFGGDLVSSVMDKVGFPDDEPIEHPMISKSVGERLKRRIEAHNFPLGKTFWNTITF